MREGFNILTGEHNAADIVEEAEIRTRTSKRSDDRKERLTNGLHGTEEVQQEGEDEVWPHQDRRYGAKGYSISPGTKKGDSYCARSAGQMKKNPKAAKNPNSPLRLSRKKVEVQRLKITEKLMPNVAGKKYPYTKAGMKNKAAAAKADEKPRRGQK